MFSSYINRRRAGRTSSEVASQSGRRQPVKQWHSNMANGNSKKENPNNDQICWQFRKGKCKNGKRCKWSHVLENGIVSKQANIWKSRTGGNWGGNRSTSKSGTALSPSSHRIMGTGPPPSDQSFSGRSSARIKSNQKGATNRKSYALPPPQTKRPSGPWESETDLPTPKKSVKKTSSEKNPICILFELSQHMKLPLDWKETETKKGLTLTVDLNGRFLAKASGPNKKAVKFAVAAKGLDVLERHSRFVEVVKRLRVGKHAFLVRDETKAMKKEGLLLLGDPSLCDRLQSRNRGYKLLLKMGWDPAKGLGQSHQGLKDPVAVKLKDNVRLGRNRRGLGFADPNKKEVTFTDGAERKVREFANSTLSQMQFSKNLEKEERALIHELAKKYHVKSKSVGKGENRSLFLFKYTK